ncbi:MAG: copper chaperone PCu(A)C [Alphaproteobacteria bacterium]|nr:copper chaperone PCu(A)C [Alphaproteobacteria bacterium]MBV9419670.1 copper chaperone PCu(A)C [Alphaproteobacteria bacterium]
MRRLSNLLVAAMAALFFVQAGSPTIAVMGPYLRFISPGVPAAGYFHMINNGLVPAAVLTGASSDACSTLMMHKSTNVGGMMRMEMVDQLTIARGQRLVFEPGGYHLMCLSPKMKIGGTVKVTFKFKDGSNVDAMFKVVGVRDKP